MLYAEVIVDISREELDRPFTYRVPEAYEETIVPGSAVQIPFGRRSREISGYVTALKHECGLPPEKVKDIISVSTDSETVESHLVSLAAWMAETYGSTAIRALKTVVPVRRRYGAVTERVASLADPREGEALCAELEKKHRSAQARVVRELIGKESVKYPELIRKAGVSASVIRNMTDHGMIRVDASEVYRRVSRDAEVFPPDILSPEQKKAIAGIRDEWENQNRPVLLRGVTGSGKTAVYIEMAAEVLREGLQAIVLIPEIALTRQTVMRFMNRFGNRVSFMHSRLSGGERYDQMKAARKGDISVMVGPRSALFTPFPKLGLIVIDEEQEEAYHSETVPRYHARETAVRRAENEGAHVILGSATPSVISSWRARQGIYREVCLKNRFGGAALPSVSVVDMRKELAEGNRSVLSRELAEAMGKSLAAGEQIMLFLNRRGYTGTITCRSCGAVIRCPHCDVSLTRHRNGKLICHYCGYETEDVRVCPSCGSRHIGGLTVGTEQVEEIVHREFPDARVLRMDKDTTGGKEGHSSILGAFSRHEADILIGTQMIVKGHDFPCVTCVGVLLADLSLNEDDYRAAERTFQLVTQAAGRAGRAGKRGYAVIQTYRPEHYAVRAAASQDYDTFYRDEIAYRQLLNYPPIGTMMAIYGSSKDEAKLGEAMRHLRKLIGRMDPGGKLMAIGPAPESVGKIRDFYRQVIYIRNRNQEMLILARKKLERYIAANKGFDGIFVQFDMNV